MTSLFDFFFKGNFFIKVLNWIIAFLLSLFLHNEAPDMKKFLSEETKSSIEMTEKTELSELYLDKH